MKLGMMGLESPRVGGRQFDSPPDIGSKPPISRPVTARAPARGGLGTSSIAGATTGGGAPPVKNLGAKIISALRARRRGMGAPPGRRRM